MQIGSFDIPKQYLVVYDMPIQCNSGLSQVIRKYIMINALEIIQMLKCHMNLGMGD